MATPPVVIFVHGIGLASEVWSPQLEWCRVNGIDAVALTLQGHGSRRSEVADVDGMISQIVSESSQHGKVILVGHSLGGWLCCKAVHKIPNVSSIVLVNPLIELSQHRRLFIWAVKAARFVQKVTGPRKRSGDFRKGSSFFWRVGIYPYCLIVNDMDKILSICKQIGKMGDAVIPEGTKSTIILPKWDEMLSRSESIGSESIEQFKDIGHMAFRSSPDCFTSALARHILRPQAHRK
ncbi:MAG: alpha/beta fold hydrolase [Nanoarchaeota archaeon]